jgi:hypothetical protein
MTPDAPPCVTLGAEITAGGDRKLEERSKAQGERLRLAQVKVGYREIVELEAAEPGSRPTGRIWVGGHGRDDVKDLLDAVDFEWNQDPTGAALGVVALPIEGRVVIPVLESKPRLGGAVSRVRGTRVAEWSIPFPSDALDGSSALFEVASSDGFGCCFLGRFGW